MLNNRQYFILIFAHIALAAFVFLFPFTSTILSIVLFGVGFLYIFKTKNSNNQVLLVSAYIVGFEVLIRATDGVVFYEFAKYGIIFFLLMGMLYSSFSKNIFPYLIYLLLLLPALYYATANFIITDADRKTISFTLSGPVCLGVAAIYCYNRKLTIENVYSILLAIGLPLISLTTYLILYNPSVRDVVTGTDSSGATSGGFGPNQVSTMVGLGIFIFLSRTILNSKNNWMLIANISISTIMAFRGIVTFSRGGIFTSIVMIIALLFIIFRYSNAVAKLKISTFIICLIFGSLLIWGYSVTQTNGLIEKRYAGKDALGRVKESRFTGREQLASSELKIFFDNPFLGCGVGRSSKIRESETGIKSASHNEITRLFAEHGTLGIAILFILFLVPFFSFFNNSQHIFLIPFFLFWLLTINHAAMRIAAPGFLYALALLKIKNQD